VSKTYKNKITFIKLCAEVVSENAKSALQIYFPNLFILVFMLLNLNHKICWLFNSSYIIGLTIIRWPGCIPTEGFSTILRVWCEALWFGRFNVTNKLPSLIVRLCHTLLAQFLIKLCTIYFSPLVQKLESMHL
jgi:hypothetical protein